MTPQGPASSYALVTGLVDHAIGTVFAGNDSAQTAYLIARAALVYVANLRGTERASEMAYALADELVGGKEAPR